MFGQEGSNSPVEPMTLGSSPSSPNSPISGGGSQYLPGYLTGSTTPNIPTPISKHWPVETPTAGSPHPLYAMNLTTRETSSHSKTPIRNIPGQRPRDKPGVPPVEGLFDNVSSPISSNPFRAVVTPGRPKIGEKSDMLTVGSGSLTSILTPSQNLNQTPTRSFVSPAQIDPFYTQGELITSDVQLDETWVTVFGFPPAAASYILQQFSQCGTILEHKIATSGNWMHIHYETKLQAKKAIGKNGKIFGETIMIGVTPCIDKVVMNESSKENSFLVNASSPFLDTYNKEASHGNIRPLTQAYKTAISEHKVTPQSRTPQKNNNIVSKAMEYIFSW